MARATTKVKKVKRAAKPATTERRKKARADGPVKAKKHIKQPDIDESKFKINFYSGILDAAEKATKMPSNSLRYLDPLSTETLQFNRALSGGWYNVFGSISGPEGSGKTTLIYHGMSSSVKNGINFTGFIDAETTLNETFAGNIFAQYGMSFRELMDDKRSPFRYYRRNVIETVFDLLHFVLKRMPDKVWVPETESWGYVIPKRSKHFAAVLEGLQLTPDKKLSTDNDFICPTENAQVEGSMFLDSLAAMVTESDDDAGEKSKRRAAEASAYSEHFKRVISRIGSKGLVFFGTNQVRKIPGQTYGDPLYEPGGEAIKFYSAQRLRIAARAAPEGAGVVRDKDVPSQALEPSVHKEGAMDRYKYKFFKNTKNKVGFPGLSGWVRVWVADAFGNVRGFDPVFDVSEYLKDTGQFRTEGRQKGQTLYVLRLKDTVGKKRANLFNSLPPFTMLTFKRLILAEAEGSDRLFVEAGKALGVSPKHLKIGGLRAALFDQIKSDKSVLQVKQKEKAGKDDEDDDDDVDEI